MGSVLNIPGCFQLWLHQVASGSARVIDECEEGTCGFQVDVVRRAVFNADWLADAPFITPPGLFAGILITSESRLVIYLFIR